MRRVDVGIYNLMEERNCLELFDGLLNDLEELVLVNFASPFGLPQFVDSFDGFCQSVVGLLVHLGFLDVKVFTATFEGGYFDLEGFSRGPRRGGASPGVTGPGGGADGITDDGDRGFLKITVSAEGGVKGRGRPPFLVNETRQEMSELVGGRFSAWIERGLGDA
jgi:hypothetical protein